MQGNRKRQLFHWYSGLTLLNKTCFPNIKRGSYQERQWWSYYSWSPWGYLARWCSLWRDHSPITKTWGWFFIFLFSTSLPPLFPLPPSPFFQVNAAGTTICTASDSICWNRLPCQLPADTKRAGELKILDSITSPACWKWNDTCMFRCLFRGTFDVMSQMFIWKNN